MEHPLNGIPEARLFLWNLYSFNYILSIRNEKFGFAVASAMTMSPTCTINHIKVLVVTRTDNGIQIQKKILSTNN